MRWVIFCWSKSSLPPEGLRSDDVIVCADSGLEYARRCGISPHIVLGDFDSYTNPLPTTPEIIRLPAEKDDTDTQFALRLGLERGVTDFLIAGGIGGRLDHTLGALATLNFAVSRGASAVMCDGKQWVEVLAGPATRRFFRNQAKYFSLISLTPLTSGITLEGFKYPLSEATLPFDTALGVSNEILAPTATLSFRAGRLAVIRTSD